MRKWWNWGLVALSTVGSVACGAEAPLTEDVDAASAALAYGGPHLLWRERSTGNISTWLLSGTTVTGTQALDMPIPYSDRIILGALDNSVKGWNTTTGTVSTYKFDANGHVTVSSLTWTCNTASGCAQAWHPVGTLSLKPASCSGFGCLVKQNGLLWYNQTTGELSIWLIASNGSTVTGSVSLSWTCTGCSSSWYPLSTADFDGDGSTDILWENLNWGADAVWLIKDSSGAIKGDQTISWACGEGCAFVWWRVGAADVNGDNKADLLWIKPHDTGELSNWLLNGQGTVTGTQTLSWTCPVPCNDQWQPEGYVFFPPQPPG